MTGWKKSEPVIQVDKVSRYFGEDCVLKEAELTLYEGQVCGIVGNKWNVDGEQMVYGADLFMDGENSAFIEEIESDMILEPGCIPEITVMPEPTAIPEPTAVPEPDVSPEPTIFPQPTPTPGFSVNIENMNIYPNCGTQPEEELFGDGSQEEMETGSQESAGYTGSFGGEVSSQQKEELTRQPKLLLESNSLTGKTLEAGTAQEVELVLENKSRDQGIYNLKLVFSTETPGIQFEKKSYYFGRISPGGRIIVANNVRTSMDAKEGLVPVKLSFEYEDKKGTSASGTEETEFFVKQTVSAHLSCDEIPAEVYSTDTVNLGIRVQNLGRTEIYNARVVMEGKGMFPKEEIFLGNMDAGTERTGTMRAFVGTRTMEANGRDEGTDERDMYGAVTGRIILKYEDGEGKPYEQVKEYETSIRKPRIQSLNIEAPKKANNWWYSVFAAAGAGLICLVFGLIHRIRRQKILLEEIRREASGENL